MIQLIQDMLPRYVGATSFDIQVLTPMRKGSLGCETLNEILQRYLNPADPHKKEHAYGNTVSGKAIRSCRSKQLPDRMGDRREIQYSHRQGNGRIQRRYGKG